MSTLQIMASKLADDVMEAMRETGNDRLFMEVSAVIGASSQTLEEAFLTEVRVRQAEITGRRFLEKKLAEARSAQIAADKADGKAPE
ncbi:MAG: hypothetical protein CML02_21330 [Pseudooceanicola sp.]|jgi:hypothetical protein|nr:hypothetical protein [Pseudooceanicola sp.]|tara:strand:+ start:2470 stop:2730 length:261 start_codon:yes stop_codon:yes gene_type:complete